MDRFPTRCRRLAKLRADLENQKGSGEARGRGNKSVINRLLDRGTRAIELALALAFIAAVLLNFVNVIGRYLFGLSLLGSDEIQVFIMVAMTFLGAAVVTRRQMHLRMDVLIKFLPPRVQTALRAIELLLLVALAAFVLTQSYDYVQRMFVLGRVSDMAGVPMWVPHGTVLVGFALMLLVAAWSIVRLVFNVSQADGEGEIKP